MAETNPLLASLLLGQKRRVDPLEAQRTYGQNLIIKGSSTAPLQSGNWLEGLARALQGGVGGYFVGEANRAEEAKGQKTIDTLAKLSGAKNQDELTAAIQGSQLDPELAGPLMAQILQNKQGQFTAAKAGGDFASAYRPAAAPMAGAPAASPAAAIGGIESGGQPNGGYGAVGPVANAQGNRAYGKYQVLDSNIGPWTQEVLGKPMTPQEFLASPEAQDKVFQTKFGQYTTQYGSPQAASRAWFAGPGGMNNPGAKDANGVSVAQYEGKFNAATGGAPQVAQGDAAPANASGTPQQPPSVTSGPPDVPRPQPTQEQIDKYKGLIENRVLTGPQAIQELDKEITGQWGMAKQQALEVWKDQQSSKRIQEQGAQRLGQEAPMTMIKDRVTNYETKIRPAAQAALDDINAIHQTRQVLDAGAFTGTGAEAKTLAAKIGEQLGIPSEQAQNTQVLGATLAKRVIVGMGGSLGTGVSNADVKFMERAAGGDIAMDEGAIRRILDIGERQSRYVLKKHDAEAARTMQLPGMAQLGGDQFAVPPAQNYAEWSKANPLPPLQTTPGVAAPGETTQPAPAQGGYQEGQTATNPQTNEKMIFQGGAWRKAGG